MKKNKIKLLTANKKKEKKGRKKFALKKIYILQYEVNTALKCSR